MNWKTLFDISVMLTAGLYSRPFVFVMWTENFKTRPNLQPGELQWWFAAMWCLVRNNTAYIDHPVGNPFILYEGMLIILKNRLCTNHVIAVFKPFSIAMLGRSYRTCDLTFALTFSLLTNHHHVDLWCLLIVFFVSSCSPTNQLDTWLLLICLCSRRPRLFWKAREWWCSRVSYCFHICWKASDRWPCSLHQGHGSFFILLLKRRNNGVLTLLSWIMY